MRRFAFIVAVLGIAFLIFLLGLSAKEVSSLDGLSENERVLVKGEVTWEKDFGDFRAFKIGKIDAVCSCDGSYLEKEILVEGYVEEYEEMKQVRVLRIEVLS